MHALIYLEQIYFSMTALVAYYSRTGRTRKIAEEIGALLDADMDEIQDSKKRAGIIGWLGAGKDSGSKSLTELTGIDKAPGDYPVVVIGSPTWNGSLSVPMRTYINQHSDVLRNVAIFSTGDKVENKALGEMEMMLGKKVFARMHLVRKQEIDSGMYSGKLQVFIDKINSFML